MITPSSIIRHHMLDHLRSGPMTARQVADLVGLTQRGTRKALSAMCDQGLIRRRGFSGSPPGQLFVIVEGKG